MGLTRRIPLAMAALLGITLAGTLGYGVIEGMSPLDALYMTVITLSTVGYDEVQPLGPVGKAFTVALIVGGVGTALYIVTALAGWIFEGRLRDVLQRTSMQRNIERLRGHLIVCGYGRFGRAVVEALGGRADVVVVDLDPGLQSELDASGLAFLIGSATLEPDLERAGVRHARALVAGMGSESDNVFVTLSALDLKPDIVVFARADSEAGVRRLRQAGAHRVVSPHQMGGLRTATSILRPSVVEFLELSATTRAEEEIDLEEIRVDEGSKLSGRTLFELEQEHGRLRIVACKRAGERMNLAPAPEAVLAAGDHVVCIGEREALQRLARLALAGEP